MTHQCMLFSSESVTEGHPDKVADQISDALLDAALEQDPAARVACETLVTGNLAVLAGEVTTSATLDAEQIARSTIAAIGYTRPDLGFNAGSARIEVVLQRQSPDIARGVDVGGAGDQGMMFGYACRETPELMPLPIRLAHRLTERLSWLRRNGALPWLLPDGKTQVSVEYDQNHDPVRVATVIVSAHHEAGASSAEIEEGIRELCVAPVLEGLDTSRLRLFVNPTGRFTVGGPAGDTGVTGRKIIVDTYGSAAPHGGGCFSGKDPTKVDRSATYAARWVAKNLVAAGLARRCEVQLSYAIGIPEPVAIWVDTKGTGVLPDGAIARIVNEVFDLTPAGIISALDLRRPVYRRTAVYGHFGRELDEFTWERLDRVDDVASAVRAGWGG